MGLKLAVSEVISTAINQYLNYFSVTAFLFRAESSLNAPP